jgi:hypothetical protein
MTKKTNIKIQVAHSAGGKTIDETYTIKIDGQGFPYVVFQNEKIIIANTSFPRTDHWIHGLWEVSLDIREGLDELQAILANPDLTVDRLSVRQLARTS